MRFPMVYVKRVFFINKKKIIINVNGTLINGIMQEHLK